RLLSEPVVTTTKGGALGGSTILTRAAERTIDLYHSIEARTRAAGHSERGSRTTRRDQRAERAPRAPCRTRTRIRGSRAAVTRSDPAARPGCRSPCRRLCAGTGRLSGTVPPTPIASAAVLALLAQSFLVCRARIARLA